MAVMKKVSLELKLLIEYQVVRFGGISKKEWEHKDHLDRWSKKEILGHLIDSGIQNIKRFTDIVATRQLYIIRSYPQDELVKINDYQGLELEPLINLWSNLNFQITRILYNIPNELGELTIKVDGDFKTLNWLVEDYLVHLKHHLKAMQTLD